MQPQRGVEITMKKQEHSTTVTSFGGHTNIIMNGEYKLNVINYYGIKQELRHSIMIRMMNWDKCA